MSSNSSFINPSSAKKDVVSGSDVYYRFKLRPDVIKKISSVSVSCSLCLTAKSDTSDRAISVKYSVHSIRGDREPIIAKDIIVHFDDGTIEMISLEGFIVNKQ